LVKRLGTGATAIVFLARHEVLEVAVAVKVLKRRLARERPEYAERFLREARMAARLDHPNVVRVSDCGIEHGYHYMVQDYVDGPDVEEMLDQGPLDWEEALRIVRQAAEGLAYAAEHGVIHRDVKPSNIMIDSSGRTRLTDLGLAKLNVKGVAALTQELHTVGTPNYMSPEQISSPGDLDLRADIYSLGATFYHMVTARPPFAAQNAMKVVANHLTKPLVPPSKVNSMVSDKLSAVICKMMAKSRTERYQDYEELFHDIDSLLEGREVGASGFIDSQQVGLDDEELQEVLDELSFAEGLDLEEVTEESDEDDVLAQAPMDGLDEAERSDAFIFRPEDQTSYRPPKRREHSDVGFHRSSSQADRFIAVVAVVVGAVVLLLLIFFVAYAVL
jgi:serine/threonine-protein kinase